MSFPNTKCVAICRQLKIGRHDEHEKERKASSARSSQRCRPEGKATDRSPKRCQLCEFRPLWSRYLRGDTSGRETPCSSHDACSKERAEQMVHLRTAYGRPHYLIRRMQSERFPFFRIAIPFVKSFAVIVCSTASTDRSLSWTPLSVMS